MTDVLMTLDEDGGAISIESGHTAMTDSLETMTLLCLFGGNEEDGGGDDTASRQWWGNLIEDDPARHLRSQTQRLLDALPAVPANLRRIEDAAALDLQPLIDAGIAAGVVVSASIPALNRIALSVDVIGIEGDEYSAQFVRPGASSA